MHAARSVRFLWLGTLIVALLAAPALSTAQRRARRAAPAPTPAPTSAPAETAPPPPTPPSASALVEQGERAYEEGDFDGALAAFDGAEQAGVDRALLVRMLGRRVLIAHAGGDAAALELNALRLVSLEPDALRNEAAPELARALAAARERADGVVRLRVEHEAVDGSLRLRARVDGDVAAMVREVRLFARRGDGPLTAGEGSVVTLPGESTDDVVVVADCTGPGGATLATLGTLAAPHSLADSIVEEVVALPVVTPPASDDTGLHIGLVVGASVLVVAAAVVISLVVVDQSAASGQLTGPVVEW